jgi:hypothetical protein
MAMFFLLQSQSGKFVNRRSEPFEIEANRMIDKLAIEAAPKLRAQRARGNLRVRQVCLAHPWLNSDLNSMKPFGPP